jgi:hypothetical protein
MAPPDATPMSLLASVMASLAETSTLAACRLAAPPAKTPCGQFRAVQTAAQLNRSKLHRLELFRPWLNCAEPL